MGYPIQFALRYLASKKRASITVGTAFAVLGVTLGVAALATIMSVTGGFHEQFRQKVLGVNAHVLVLKYSTNFREYRDVMARVAEVDGVIGVAPFSINPMMITHGDATATGVLVKGVDPELSLGVPPRPDSEWGTKFRSLTPVLDLPQYIIKGSLSGLRRPGAKPAGGRLPPPEPFIEPPPVPAEADGGADDEAHRQRARDALRQALDPDAGRLTSTRDAGPGTDRSDAGRTTLDDDDEPTRDAGPGLGADQDNRPDAGLSTPDDAEPTRDAGLGADPDQLDAGAPAIKSPRDAGLEADPNQLDAGVADRASPFGAVEPDGGYSSVLPDDDELPEDVDPDLCADPEAVEKMPGIVVGVSLADTLDLKLGDCLTVTSPTIGFSFVGGKVKPPVAVRFRVIAVFEAGFDQYDSKLVYTDLYEAQQFYDHGDTVTGVEMKVEDIDTAKGISKTIAEALSSGLYHTMDWEELNHGLFTALKIQQFGMSAVLALIIVVAAFTVIATLIMAVLDKTKEISVLKAMGATDNAVMRIFLYQGGIIGLVGTTTGLLLGLAVCEVLLGWGFPLDPKVYFISRLPVQVRPLEFAITGIIALGICLVATIVPSLYAASVRPADGFRNQ